ncbi:tyrosine-protein phosphatase 69D isoform X2 [Agrilus planipennis]|uniref:protein-tyrosine-phosphatase n=1 Tax=Agrilus planipennis TaxID=224129 RepID=A0A1W4XDU9_AGRPL|nr:tyrosine-protein phosphatase 69D isoform X2 [Agrilus planipennis]
MFRSQALRIYVGYLFLFYCRAEVKTGIPNIPPQTDELATTIEVLKFESSELPFGENVTLICKTSLPDSHMWWTVNEKNVTEDERHVMERTSEINTKLGKKYEVLILHILEVDLQHEGIYTCHATDNEKSEIDFAMKMLNVTWPANIIEISPHVRTKLHQPVNLTCSAEGYPLSISWYKNSDLLTEFVYTESVNKTFKVSSFQLKEVTKKDNGTFICSSKTGNFVKNASTAILVIDKPQVSIDFVKALGTSKIFLNWTVNDGNEPSSLYYEIQYRTIDDPTTWLYYSHKIGGGNRSYVLENVFKNNTEYSLRMRAYNSEGESQYSETIEPVKTLSEDPVFIPEVKVTGFTVNSITISWTVPSNDLKDHIHYYQLMSHAGNISDPLEAVHLASKENLYMFSDLKAATTYSFQVAACNEYSHQCGPWSGRVNATTMDGISGPPENVLVTCKLDNVSQISVVSVQWTPPSNPHGTIMFYNVILEGNASFINEQGIREVMTWGPKVSSVSKMMPQTRFYNVSANTNYTVRVSAVTKTKRNGEYVEAHCTMPRTVPDKQKLGRFSWQKVEEGGKWMFKLFLSRISERNGPICCYRVYLVRMEENQKLAELPVPEGLNIMSYQEAHRTPQGGAYVAEMFSSSSFQSEIFLGDEQVVNDTDQSLCRECIGLRPYSSPKEFTTNKSSNRVRRNVSLPIDPLDPYDGSLNIGSNYTGFVEITVRGEDQQQAMATYSSYLVMMSPGPEVVMAPPSSVLSVIVQVLCGLCVVTLLLLAALCILHRYNKQTHAQAVEITFRTSFRSLRGRQRLVSLNPPDMCPILKSELVSAYLERHRDSDYGFQQEFELLPDRFNDRTTRASDARENVYKNRYPDIKAYDQTRVKLSQIDSIAGSDYINANYVLGYKERKKFICAQGPMDTTVNDFWRMIWEQHLELILMLTNLEEYSKNKCAKYWPDKTEGDKVFGNFTVSHLQETRYSDYIRRELKLIKNSNGKHDEERQITQYHYLVWKDFMAPEHPHGIIKFIKRMNEVYSPERGSILVHCSAGVGRTGTLVALDCLLQQLKEETQVAIFNTICDLRHQRNFLVQSLKQYVFIYRALMEVALYGDTEINASELKLTVEKLKDCDKDKNRCKMEEEFENIKNAFEDRKSCSVGSGEENLEKNRNESVIPYDRNRVILTPLPSKEHSTYINASFIEGYDNSESFIITQDPIENTVADFWRMISEQGITVIVMLSELGENKCPRYWPEDEACYDHITVRYVQAESCPYYTRRELFVRSRDGDDLRVTHLQYHGWPTVDGEVPEVTRGLIELVDHAQSTLASNGASTAMVVHCELGAERSSLFVGLSILVQQLRVERRVDVFTVTRKLRSQRHALISTYAQYEFLHRAIVNYAELHNLCETST